MYRGPQRRKAFHYRLPANPPPGRLNRPQAQRDQEVLTGAVQGKPASDIEERYARALEKSAQVETYEFIVHEITGANLPGEAQIDFVVTSGGQRFVVMIDGSFAHKSAAQKAADMVQDARLSQALVGLIAPPTPVSGVAYNGLIARVPGMLLASQAEADRLVQEMF